ncbi:MAG: hypothetical protein GY793_00560 [Proteobacteria bacterium]|nr:hypothetical protein [Pseudomonadota bacterium]
MVQKKIALKSEFTILSWKVAATFIGGSLPLLLLGKAVLAVWISMGLIFGVLAMIEDRPSWAEAREVFFSNIGKVTFIVLLVFAASALNSFRQHYSLVRFYEMFYLSVASGLFVLILKKMPKEFVMLAFKTLGITTLVMGLLVLVDSFVDIERLRYLLHGDKIGDIHRLEQMGTVLAVLSPFVWIWLFKMARKDDHYWAKRFGLPLSYVLFFTVIVCGGTSAWISCFVGIFVFLALGGKWHGLAIRSTHWVMMPSAIFLAFLGYLAASGVQHIRQNIPLGEEYFEYFDFVHKSIDFLAETPVLGIGVNATRFLPTPDAVIGRGLSQNFLLQLLVETGFLGLGAALVLFGIVLYRLYEYAKVDTYGLAGLSSMVIFFTASLSNTSIFNAWWLAFFIALSSLSIRLCKN